MPLDVLLYIFSLAFSTVADGAKMAGVSKWWRSQLEKCCALPREMGANTTKVDDDAILSMISQFPLMKIQVVDLSDSKLTDAGVQALASLTGLQELRLRSCSNITDAGVQALAALSGLKCLDLSDSKLTEAGVQALAALTSLQRLDLSFCDITDEVVIFLAKKLKGLVELDLSYCSNITDAGVRALAALTSLQHLELAGCTNLTLEGVRALAALKSIQYVNLWRCDLDVEDVKSLFAGHPNDPNLECD